MSFPKQVELRRSPALATLSVATHALAAACLVLLPIPMSTVVVGVAFVVWSAWRVLQPHSAHALRLGARGDMTLLSVDREPRAATVLPESVVFGILVVLRVRDDSGRREDFTLLPDSMSTEDFRILRLWLRWRVSTSGPAVDAA